MTIKARVFVLPGGKVQIFIDSGTEEEAKTATRAILAKMQAAGINFAEIGEIELHRTGAEHVHVITDVRQEVGNE
ncbi:MAG: hypothetical protein ABI413_11280 [Ktedonobacteraceae bacterium]